MKDTLKTCLYLDDVRTPTTTIPGYHPWEVVRTYDEFVNWVSANGIPDLVSFDHDLGKEHMDDYYDQMLKKGYQEPKYEEYTEKTGLHCAMWLVEFSQKIGKPIKSVSVHSHNPVGAKNIQDCINGYKKHCDEIPDAYIGRHPFIIEK